ncbi:hypothetical protein ACFVZ2_34565, partial [Streptomyces lasiicapitis]
MTTEAVAKEETAPADRTPLVELDAVSKYYGNIRALEGVSLEVGGRGGVGGGWLFWARVCVRLKVSGGGALARGGAQGL